jgi:four helix bundle protein
MNKRSYIPLHDLEVYQLARSLSGLAWEVYESLPWQIRKIIGDQFIESADSVGANIVEGYSRYYYLEKIKFFYNSRGSLNECCCHWLELLEERNLVTSEYARRLKDIYGRLSLKLNNFIKTTYEAKRSFVKD